MFEQFWYQGFCKLILVDDDEGVSFLGPPYQVLLSRVLEETRNFSFVPWTVTIVPYLLSFWTKGGICLRFASASRFARRAC